MSAWNIYALAPRYGVMGLGLGLLSLGMLSAQAPKEPCLLTLKGLILDIERREPIPYVSVYLDTQSKVINDRSLSSDTLGRFEFKGLCAQNYRLRLTHTSYYEHEVLIQLSRSLDTTWYMEENVSVLEEIWVEAHKTETLLPEGRLSRSKILNSNAKDLGELLEQIPGVSVLRQGSNVSRPMIDGLGGDRVVIIHQDLLQADQSWGRDHSPAIDPLSLGEASVLHGPGLLRYSSSALGGMIILRPPDLSYEKGLASIDGVGHYQSNGHRWGSSVALSKGFVLNKALSVSSLGMASVKRGGDTSSPRYLLSNTGIREASTSLHLGLRYKRWTNEIRYIYFGGELAILRSSHTGSLSDLQEAISRGSPFYVRPFSYEISEPKQENLHHIWKAKSMLQINKQERLELVLSYQLNRRKEFEARRSNRSGVPSTDMRLGTYDVNLFWEAHHSSDRLITQLGTGIRSQTHINVAGTGRRPFLADYKEEGFSLFALQSVLFPLSSWEVSFRYDQIGQKAYVAKDFLPTTRFHSFSSVVGYNQSIGDRWALHAHLGLAERIPGMNERYSSGVHHGIAAIEEGTAGLKKESSLKGEVHLHREQKAWKIETRIYYQEIKDFIYAALQSEPRLTIRGSFPVFSYEQDDAALGGAHLVVDYEPLSWLSYGLGLSIIRGWNRSLEAPLIRMPADRLSHEVQATWQGPLWPVVLSFSHLLVDRQGRYPKDLDISAPPAGYHLFDTRLSLGPWQMKRGKLRAFLGVENIFNASYKSYLNYFRYFSEEPGRNLWIRLIYTH